MVRPALAGADRLCFPRGWHCRRPSAARTALGASVYPFRPRMASRAIYYDAHPIEHMRHHLTMLAYDMNGEPLSYGRTHRCVCATNQSTASSRSGGSVALSLSGTSLSSEPADLATTKITNSSGTA